MTTPLRLTDFRMAGFLVARGHKVSHVEVNARGDVEFIFDASAHETLAKLPGSPEQVYDSACKAMHDIVKAKVGRLPKRR